MAFVVGSLIIGGVTAVAGGAIAAKGAKDAAKIGAKGASEELAFERESRDLAIEMGGPYRDMGYKALNRLGEMTGLGTVETPGEMQYGSSNVETAKGSPWANSPWDLSWENGGYIAKLPTGETQYWNDQSQSWQSSRGSSYGSGGSPYGNAVKGLFGRAQGGALYNVNEIGPEDIYRNGNVTRTAEPKTIPADPTGYVAPNIQGRATGGMIPVGMNNPNPTMLTTAASQQGKYGSHGYRDPRIPSKYGSIAGDESSMNPSGAFGSVTSMPASEQSMPGASTGTTIDGATGQPVPVENPYPFEVDPGYQFRLNEGMRALESSAAARGGLMSGGFARKALRYGQDYATNEYTNIYNRIASIANIGQVMSQSGGNQALAGGQGMGNAAANRAITSAYGQQGATNAWANTINELGKLPWGDIFKKPEFAGKGAKS